jgi:hypothetical protein
MYATGRRNIRRQQTEQLQNTNRRASTPTPGNGGMFWHRGKAGNSMVVGRQAGRKQRAEINTTTAT